MEWKDLIGLVGKAAPVVGGLLGGPAGVAVGGLIASAIGSDNTPDAVNTAIAANPDLMFKITELQTNAQVQLQQLAVTAEQNRLQSQTAQYAAEVADRNGARDLAAKTPDAHIREYVTYGLLVGAFVIVALVLSGTVSGMLKDATTNLLIGTIIGYWFNELKQASAFWFGATRDSSNQMKTISDFAVQPGTVTHDVTPKT